MFTSILFYAKVLIALLFFIIPIITDFMILKKTASIRDNLIYTFIKTVFYFTYPFFIVYFVDYYRTSNLRDIISMDSAGWFLLFGGLATLVFAKYIVFKFFKVKDCDWALFVEIIYAPFLFAIILLAFW